jgi:hypothetical protein
VGLLSLQDLKKYVSKMESIRFEKSAAQICVSESNENPVGRVLHEQMESCLGFVKEGSSLLVSQSLRRARTVLSLDVFLLEFVPMLMHRVGESVFHGELAIWQEHVLTSSLRSELAIAEIDARMVGSSFSRRPEKIFVFATLEGNHHETAILIASLVAAMEGFESHFVGSHLPAAEFVKAMHALGGTHAVVGAKELPPGEERLNVVDYVKILKSSLQKKQCIWVGGRFGVEQQSGLENLPGVSVFSSLAEFRAAVKKA